MRLGLDLLFLVPGETGGRETYARGLIPALLDADPTLDPVAFANRDGSAEWAHALDLPVVVVPTTTRRAGRWALGELVQLPVAGARAGVELMHSLANFGPASGPFTRVLTLHDLQWRAVPGLVPPGRRLATGALVGAAVRGANRVITVSQTSRNAIVQDLHLDPERVDAVPNGVDRGAGEPAPEAQTRQWLGLTDRSLVLTIATALPHKNLDGLLQALALISPAQRPLLVLAGAHTDSESLRRLVDDLSLHEDVRLLGFVPAPVLERLYLLAAGVVVPSLYEGFGLPVAEALARGVPVACSDLPVLRELAGDGALYFAPFRAQEIADTIRALLCDPARVEHITGIGQARVSRLSWKAAAKATLASYRRATGRG